MAARSARDIASRIFSELFDLLANLITASRAVRVAVFAAFFLRDDLKALLAVLVTGILGL